jgi:uncharacterized protein
MEHQRFEGDRTLMRVHVGEGDRWHGKPLYQAIIELLRQEGFYGATVFRGCGGYGSSSRYHTDNILRLSQDLPIIIEVVEYAERIEKILPKLDEMVDGGLITLEKAHVIRYRPKQAANK